MIFDSDDTDADSDFYIENVESDSDESTDQTTSNVRRRSPSLSGENITIISEPEFFLGQFSLVTGQLFVMWCVYNM